MTAIQKPQNKYANVRVVVVVPVAALDTNTSRAESNLSCSDRARGEPELPACHASCPFREGNRRGPTSADSAASPAPGPVPGHLEDSTS